MGDLTDRIEQFATEWRPSQGPSCSVGELIAALPESESEAFSRLLTTRIYSTDIARFVQGDMAAGHVDDRNLHGAIVRVKSDALQRHRRGSCGCTNA